MRLIFTSDLAGLGGGEVGLLYLLEHLKTEHDCLCIVGNHGSLVDELNNRGIPAEVIPYKNKATIFFQLQKLHKVISKFKPDAIINNDPTTSVLLKIASKPNNIPNFWIAHGQWYQFSKIRRKLILQSVSKVFCVSNAVQENLMRQGFERCQTIYLGVPEAKFCFVDKGKNPLLYAPGAVKIVTIARFQKIKGQAKGVEAVARLISDGFNVHYYLVGGSVFGSAEDDEYEASVKAQVEKLSLGDRIHFLGEQRAIPQIMSEADILLIPSDNESLGLVALEAIMAGLPIVSTPNDGVKEILNNNSMCISSSNDAEGLYRVLRKQIEAAGSDTSLSLFFDALREKYSIKNVAKALVEGICAEKKDEV